MCAGGALAIIVYRNYMKKKKKQEQRSKYWKFRLKMINRQIYKGLISGIDGDMAKEVNDWWEGLGKELETDIETFLDNEQKK